MAKVQPREDQMQVRYTKTTIKRVSTEDGTPGVIEGTSAKVDEPYNMGWYMEVIKKGAFDKVLADDIRILFNHDSSMILARTKSKTGEVFLTPEGHLAYRYTTPDRSYAKDLEDAIDKGDIDECSFAFRVLKSNWVEEKGQLPLWEIVELERLYDVGPVTYGANPSTTVAKRSYDAFVESNKPTKELKPTTLAMRIRKRQLSLD